MIEMSKELHQPHINGDYESLDEPEEFFLWPFLRISFGIVLMAIELTAIIILARLWSKDYQRLSEIDPNPQTPVKFFLENMTTGSYQGDRSTSWFGTPYSLMCNSHISGTFCSFSCCLHFIGV